MCGQSYFYKCTVYVVRSYGWYHGKRINVISSFKIHRPTDCEAMNEHRHE